ADAVEAVYGRRVALPQVLRFGTWVGGDMDGNPNVGADTIRAALDAQRAQVIAQYRNDLRALGDALTQTSGRVDVDAALLETLDEHAAAFPEAFAQLSARHADMPYRRLLALMRAKLAATASSAGHGYRDAAAFIADLELIDASLQHHRGEHAGRFALQRLVWRVRTFGFHLAALDLRQDSAVHDAALAALLDDATWAEREAADKATRLHA